MKLDFDDLKYANYLRCEDVFHKVNNWSPSDWATAMAGECGEACNEVKKLRRLDDADKNEDTPENRAAIIKRLGYELADVVIYADLLASRMGINLGQNVIDKFNIISDKRGSNIKL